MTFFARSIVPAMTGIFAVASIHAQVLTVQVGSPPLPPTPLVSHNDTWFYHKGTNAPQASWQTIADGSLNADWGSGPGGFGYGDNAITNTPGTSYESTMLSDMLNRYTTFFIRRTFNVASTVDTNLHLLLKVDYDDAFVAYLDGAELQRANTTNGVGSVITYTQTSGGNSHEASCCNAPTNLPTTFDLGAVSNRLSIGTHILAIVGLNQTLSSSDFHLIPDLSLTGGAGSSLTGAFGTLVTSNSVTLSGTNSVAGSARVTVNGDDATYVAVSNTWSRSQSLKPGLNRLYIAALDSAGNVLSNITTDVIYQTSSVTLNGVMASSVLASNGGTVVYVTGNVLVPTNVTLDVANGAVVLANPGVSITTQDGGRIYAHGTFDEHVYFSLNGAANLTWGPLSGTGTNASIELSFVDVSHAQVNARNGANGLVQDCDLHDFDPGAGAGTLGRPIMNCNFATLFEARRVHVWNYYECLVRNGIIHIEHCVFERMSGDALDFDSAQPGSYTRRCTYRHGDLGNVDAVDIGPSGDLPGSTDTRIEDSIMWDFPFDKGVSVGDSDSSHGIIVSNCLIYSCFSGVQSKTMCDVSVRNCTIVNCNSGLTNYNKDNPASPTGGGITTNSYNNIVWSNTTTIGLANDSRLYADHNDFGNTNWPGVGNIDVDPLFVNAATRNYRLQAGSPCRGVGRNGEDLGVTYPLGGIPVQPLRLAVLASGTNALVLNWIDDSQNEDGVIVQRSTDALNWTNIATLGVDATNHTDSTALLGQKYYYRVQHTNYLGLSPYSNVGSGTRQPSVVFVGGTISVDTVWAAGSQYVVTSSVTVAVGATLTIDPGVEVAFNSGLKMTVNGRLLAEGNASNHIHFTRSGVSNWNGLDFINTTVESRLAYIDFDSCAGSTVGSHSAQLHVNGGSIVFIDHCTWPPTPVQEYISFDGSSFIVQNCYFPSYPPPSGPESLHGVNGIPITGYGIFRSNYFGHTWGFNDTIDFTGGQRPGAILQFLNNIFDGASDDHLDLDSTDAWIEGNIFMHAHRDPTRGDNALDTASAISGGVDTVGQNSDWTIINNIFYDVDHVFLNKGNSTTTPNGGGRVAFLYNTVVHVAKEYSGSTAPEICIFNWSDDDIITPAPNIGSGMYAAHNIFVDAPVLQRFYFPTSHTVIFDNNIFPPSFKGTSNEWTGAGSGNQYTNPMLNLTVLAGTDPTNVTAAQLRQALQLLPGSPALGTAFGGRNIGALNTNGIAIAGEPSSPTSSSNTTLTVGPCGTFTWGTVGAQRWGWTAFKWKLDNGPWSSEIVISNPPPFTNLPTITLSNLANGSHTVYVSGRNDVGYYQDDPFVYSPTANVLSNATASRTWVVGPPDTDSDGLPDDWELQYFGNLNQGAGGDPDGDGMTNLQEYLAGTNPTNAASRLSLSITPPAGNAIALEFNALSNRSYGLLYRASLSTGNWIRVQEIPAAPTNRSLVITTNLPVPSRFFEIQTP